jgi:hypothetical protein
MQLVCSACQEINQQQIKSNLDGEKLSKATKNNSEALEKAYKMLKMLERNSVFSRYVYHFFLELTP